jgi:hypothetical protein
MARADRLGIITQIEQHRGSRVLTYVIGDRALAAAQIGDDALRPLYDHLRALGHVEKLDLFLYSRGGAIDVPWRIASALRRVSDEWNILVPFRANSAATLLALGADNILLGQQGELGPVDPIMSRVVQSPDGAAVMQEQISVEDVMAYVKFVTEKFGLSDQDALSSGLGKLSDKIDAVLLGSIYRTQSHIRSVARRVLLSRKQPASEQALLTIIETLAERTYAHGHAIGLKEAEEIGLPAKAADPTLDKLMWSLLQQYEQELKLLEPLDPAQAIGSSDKYVEDAITAVIESTAMMHAHKGKVEITAKRQMPPTLNVSFQINIQVPPSLLGQQVPANLQPILQQMLQQAQQALQQQAMQAVQQALQAQAPLVGLQAAFRGGHWELVP